jgi:serine/threonine protein kinase
MPLARMEADADKGPLQVGGKLLKYTIRGLLGRGGYAWVYDGYDAFLDVEVAIKVLHRAGGVSADMLRRGQAEAKFLYRLRHENVVEVLDAGITDAGLYIVMELLRGPTLRLRLQKEGPLPLGQALPFFAQVCDGIGAAHAIKAIHRDIKPENLVIQSGNRAKVLDFGVVKVIDAVGGTTERDVVHGTVLYLSPEQLNGVTATPRSDVYALGLTLFEALYGKHPLLLRDERPTQAELPWLQLTVTPPRLDKLDGRIPRDIARLVERMLVKDPALRIASMQQCATELRACAASLTPSGIALVSSVTEPTGVPVLRAPHAQRARDTDHDGDAFDAAVTIPRTPEPVLTSNGTERLEPRRLLADVPVATLERPGSAAPPRVAVAVKARPTAATVAPVTRADDAHARHVLDTAPPRLILKWVAICAFAGAVIGGVVLRLTAPASPSRRSHALTTFVPPTPAPPERTPTHAPLPRAAPVASTAPSSLVQRSSPSANASPSSAPVRLQIASKAKPRAQPRALEVPSTW